MSMCMRNAFVSVRVCECVNEASTLLSLFFSFQGAQDSKEFRSAIVNDGRDTLSVSGALCSETESKAALTAM